MIARLFETSAPSNDKPVGFDLSTRTARANWAGVGRELMLGHGTEHSILHVNHQQNSDVEGGD
jgi:hypothetical protein